jgi:hypothetical protein
MDEKEKDQSCHPKIRDSLFCRKCGEPDRGLLEARHYLHFGIDRSLTHDYEHGSSLCLWCRAHEYRPGAIRDKMLARLAVILYKRLRPNLDLRTRDSVPIKPLQSRARVFQTQIVNVK